MCVNDLICQGAEPLFFLDYFATGKLVIEDAEEIISGIATGCEKAGCTLAAKLPKCRVCIEETTSTWPDFLWEQWKEGKSYLGQTHDGDIILGFEFEWSTLKWLLFSKKDSRNFWPWNGLIWPHLKTNP